MILPKGANCNFERIQTSLIMRNYALVLCFVVLACACNNQTDEKKPVDATISSGASCYQWTNNKDTVTLSISEMNGNISGTLIYSFFEKDRNTGTLTGELKDDLLVADYSFISEGTASVRQVAFKRQGDEWIEAHGEAEEKDGKTVFKNLDSLDFSNPIILKKSSCK